MAGLKEETRMSTQRRLIIGAELRAETADNSLIIFGRAVKYGALSQPGVPGPGCRERMAPGCFKDGIAAGDDVVALVNHDPSRILGRIRNGSLRLTDDSDSLRFDIRLNPNVQAHRDLHALVKDGTLSECSFAFGAVDDDWSAMRDERGNRYQLRTVKRAKLYDCSIVTTPAYSDGATAAHARNLAYNFGAKADPWAAERAKLAELDARFEDECNRIRCERLGMEVAADVARVKAE